MAKTILIVEDNPMSLHIAKELLEPEGFEVIEAKDAVAGIELAVHSQPDLILMDMHLPGKDGYTACRELKANAETKHIPIVGFTAFSMDEDQEKARANGCSGVIGKPIDVDTFAQSVASYLESPVAVNPSQS